MSIGVDIGGTKILAGIVTEAGEVVATARRATPRNDASDVLELVAEVVNELVAGTSEPLDGVGLGVAGLVDAERSRVYFAPNLRWSQVPVRTLLEAATGLPVVVENDGNVAAWGEFRFGAGKDANDLTLVTVGTGIGGGIVLGRAAVPRGPRRRRRDRPHQRGARRATLRMRSQRLPGAVRERQRTRAGGAAAGRRASIRGRRAARPRRRHA